MLTQTAEFPITPRWMPGSTAGTRRVATYLLALAGALAAARAAHLTVDGVAPAAASVAPAGVMTDFGQRGSHGGLYRAEVVATDPVRVGATQRWTVRLERRNRRRLAGAHVQVRTWTPETGEASPVQAMVRRAGSGRYELDGVYFPRAGWWTTSLVVEGRDGVDSVAFNVRIP